MITIEKLIREMKVRIAFIGHPKEPMNAAGPDWSKVVRMMDDFLSQSQELSKTEVSKFEEKDNIDSMDEDGLLGVIMGYFSVMTPAVAWDTYSKKVGNDVLYALAVQIFECMDVDEMKKWILELRNSNQLLEIEDEQENGSSCIEEEA